MYTILAILLFAFQRFYEAQVPSFGCSSSGEISELQGVRADTATFQKLLYTQVVYGQCIPIAQGVVVEGTLETADTTVLRINAQSDPPGYMVPLGDFKPVKAHGKQ
jgi:hypothetical protein